MFTKLVQQLSVYSREEWEELLAQWEELRRTHYQLLRDNAEAVPDQMRRLAWLSRLETRIPGLLVDAQFMRMTKRSAVAPAPPSQRSGRMPRARRGEVEENAAPRPASNAIIPGLAAETAPEQTLHAAGPSAEALLRQRGRRPSAQDVAAGYDFAAEEPRDGQS
ncbi:hypothetical protein [Candidatus Viridilinea mediisalina]|uniref:hypothetical protein n=1 Tax=Candidatus Viridilinea mediisalina TaxID=2024553 RepID=UPI000F5AED1A|nr:hypothetical protein [Candidatus Viridilinea mediisalina]